MVITGKCLIFNLWNFGDVTVNRLASFKFAGARDRGKSIYKQKASSSSFSDFDFKLKALSVISKTQALIKNTNSNRQKVIW